MKEGDDLKEERSFAKDNESYNFRLFLVGVKTFLRLASTHNKQVVTVTASFKLLALV